MIDKSLPHLCAELSAIAYGLPTMLALEPLGMTWVQTFQSDTTQAYLCGDGYTVFLAWRGTDEVGDVIHDARYVKTDFTAGGRVHKGFLAAFDDLWLEIWGGLLELDSRLPLVITGHSLGGALAILSAAIVQPESVHVFGCPRVGNGRFVKLLAGIPITRWEARRDLVTCIPPPVSPLQAAYALGCRRLPTLYRHAGVARRCDSSGHAMDGYRRAMAAREAGE